MRKKYKSIHSEAKAYMSSDSKTKDQLAQEYVDYMIERIGEGKIYPENLKDAYCSGYLRGTIDTLLKEVADFSSDISVYIPGKIKEDA